MIPIQKCSTIFLAALLSWFMWGCANSEECASEVGGYSGPFTSLMDHSLWSEVAEEDDPFAGQRPETAFCPAGSWYLEAGSVEVETGLCSWFTVAQPLQHAVGCGDELKILVWHQDLASLQPGEGYVALWVEDRVLWEKTVSIPSEAQVYEMTWSAEFSVEKGETLYLHLHNHGANTWNIFSLESRSR